MAFEVRDDSSSSLVALDRATGDEWWRVDAPPDTYWEGAAITGTVYACNYDPEGTSRVLAVDEDGRTRWDGELGGPLAGAKLAPRITVGESVLWDVAPAEPLPSTVAVNRSTGTLDWKLENHGIVTILDDLVVLQDESGDFTGIRPDGTEVWTGGMQAVPRFSIAGSDPVYRPPEIVTSGEYFYAAYTSMTALEAWNAKWGSRSWRLTFDDTVDALYVVDDEIYVSTGGSLVALRDD